MKKWMQMAAVLVLVSLVLVGCGGKPTAEVTDTALTDSVISAQAVFSKDCKDVEMEITITNDAPMFSGSIRRTEGVFSDVKKGESYNISLDLTSIGTWTPNGLKVGGASVTSGFSTTNVISSAGAGAEIACKILCGKDELASFTLTVPE